MQVGEKTSFSTVAQETLDAQVQKIKIISLSHFVQKSTQNGPRFKYESYNIRTSRRKHRRNVSRHRHRNATPIV